jgi:copper chaperone CopZ
VAIGVAVRKPRSNQINREDDMNNWERLSIGLTALLVAAILVSEAQAVGVQRTSYLVSNLSCSSCLATIEAELKGLPGTIGMDADLQRGRVIVDHQPELGYERIASTITNIGYPAKVDWTATVPDQKAIRYSSNSKFSSGCGSGGCGSSGAGGGTAVWNTKIPTNKAVNRTTFQVSNLSCISCLANIEAKLKTMPQTIGMNAYLRKGVVIVDHDSTLNGNTIAGAITTLGYPAKVVSTNKISAQKALAEGAKSGKRNRILAGSGCNTRGPCNATSTSWKKLYNRYVGKQNAQ